MQLSRAEAIEILARHELREKDREWRAEELFCFSVSDTDDNPAWAALPQSLREEIVESEIADPEHARFDPVLLISLKAAYAGAINAFIEKWLVEIGHAPAAVVGEVEDLASCPCCGRKTLGVRGYYEICPVCWWEDNGQDNANASDYLGGPNGKTTLTVARANVLRHGIAKPERDDLRALQDPPEMYVAGRTFAIADDGRTISEVGTDWRAQISDAEG